MNGLFFHTKTIHTSLAECDRGPITPRPNGVPNVNNWETVHIGYLETTHQLTDYPELGIASSTGPDTEREHPDSVTRRIQIKLASFAKI